MTSMECQMHYRIFMFLGMCVTFITVDGYNGNKIFAKSNETNRKHNNKSNKRHRLLFSIG